MAARRAFYLLPVVTQLPVVTREYDANKNFRGENHCKYIDCYKIKDSLSDTDCDGCGLKWIFSNNKILRRHLGRGPRKAFTLAHEENPRSAFCTSLLLITEDISSNPGPTQYPCAVCLRAAASNHRALLCDGCSKWCHIGPKCGKVKPNEYKILMKLDHFNWMCPRCRNWESSSGLGQEQHQDPNSDQDVYGDLKENLNTKGLKVAHIYVNGLYNKLNKIKFPLEETKLDVLAITETHLHKDINDDQLQIEGYCFVRNDRRNAENNWGCCHIYFAADLEAFEREDFKHYSDIESVWIELIISSQRLIVGAIYRQPDDLSFYENLHKVLDQIWIKRNNMLLLGDFNSDLNFKVNSQEDTYLGRKLMRVLNSFNMRNVINQATRHKQVQQS